jgi:inner membrane protein
MDPVAHTLFGATLAETGLKKLTRYATPALIVGANLPDIDVVAHFWGPDAALYFRRGWTHGLLAWLLLPLLLAGGIWLWHVWRGRYYADAPPLRMPMLVGLCFLGVWSHPLLDWLNTYGVRLLMPLSDRWFYGDTLFIVDPWFWLLTAAGLVLSRSHGKHAIGGWLLLALVTTLLVVSTHQVTVPVKVGWILGIGAIALLRWRKRGADTAVTVARTGFVVLLVYIGAMYGFARLAESAAANAAGEPVEAQANPLPGTPLSHRMVLVFDTHYRVIPAQGDAFDVPRTQPTAVVQAALQADSIRGFVNWMRYPYWEVEETNNGWIVTFRDLRYVDPGQRDFGIGVTQVEISKDELK